MANSGVKNAHYYKYTSGGNFQLKGSTGSPVETVESATSGETGFFFFDTVDSQPPTDNNGDGIYDNLTEDVVLTAGWNAGGFIYMNARSLSTQGLGNFPPARPMYAPGEPWIESNGIDGWQSGETVLHLTYPTGDPTALPRPTFTKVNTTTTARTAKGPSVDALIHMAGIIYNSGFWNVKGNGKFFGSVITKQGIIEGGGGPAALSPTSGSTSA